MDSIFLKRVLSPIFTSLDQYSVAIGHYYLILWYLPFSEFILMFSFMKQQYVKNFANILFPILKPSTKSILLSWWSSLKGAQHPDFLTGLWRPTVLLYSAHCVMLCSTFLCIMGRGQASPLLFQLDFRMRNDFHDPFWWPLYCSMPLK